MVGGDSFIGKLRSNMLGTQFTIYDGGENSKARQGLLGDKAGGRMEITGVLYDTNVLGFKGPRRMTGWWIVRGFSRSFYKRLETAECFSITAKSYICILITRENPRHSILTPLLS